jgi:hypothetical protein
MARAAHLLRCVALALLASRAASISLVVLPNQVPNQVHSRLFSPCLRSL